MAADRTLATCRRCGASDVPLNVEHHPFPQRLTFICSPCYAHERTL